jgi:hypothetical protein
MVKGDVFCLELLLGCMIQPRAVIVANLHAKRQRLLRHIAAYATHPENPEDLAPRIMSQSRGRRSPPFSSAEGRHTHGQVPESTQEKKDAHVRCGIVDGCWRVGHADPVGSASQDVHLVVPGAIVADEAE